MLDKVLIVAGAAAFLAASNVASAQVGGNAIPQYGKAEASKNRKATNEGVGPNSAPSYSKMEASKNRHVTNHGTGGNVTPTYSKTGTH